MSTTSASFRTRLKERSRRAKSALRAAAYRGAARACPMCERTFRKFLPYGTPPRDDARCPMCGSLERHRLTWHFFSTRTDLFSGNLHRVLHVAPERCFEPRLRNRLGAAYVTCDLTSPKVDVRMDVTAMPFPDGHFDAIYCSHVLEHVRDDRQALREFRRVLNSRGWAVLLVPITVERTYEDDSIVDPAGRLRAFGQADHVRRYGADFVDRVREGGFDTRVFGPGDLLDAESVRRYGLTAASGELYYCRKAPGA